MAYNSLEALVYGDGAGGKMTTDIDKGVIRILKDSDFTYKTATIAVPSQTRVGKVVYKKPEILGVQDYDNKTNWKWQIPQASDIEISIDKRKLVRVKLEDFDTSRLGDWKYIVDMVINSIGYAILNDLNAVFYSFLAKAFDPTNGELRPANPDNALVYPNLVKRGVTSEEAREVIYNLQVDYINISRTYSKEAMGIPKSELMLFLDPLVSPNIQKAYWGQPNVLGERVIANGLEKQPLGGGVSYVTDKMIGINLAANQSFNLDYALDTTAFAGFIIHNEAIGFPLNLQKTVLVTDTDDGNPKLITKYQYGIGFIRPNLVVPIYKAKPTAKIKGK